MQTVDLNARTRQGTGKQVTRKMRVIGQIPATLYGAGETPVTLQVMDDDLDQLFRGKRGASMIINLAIDDAKPVLSIIREKQRHPVSGATLHLDFQRISLDKPITAQVPVRITGESPGVKDQGGILEFLMRSADVSCLPMNIPEEIMIDISELEINDSVHVGDIPHEGFEFMADEDRTIISVSAPRLSTEAEEAEEGEGEEGVEGAEGEAVEGDAAAEDKGDDK